MKYLVTGGAGFIGSNIAKRLLELGEEVVVLDNFSTGKRENVLQLSKGENGKEKLTVIEGDLRSFHTVRSAVKGVDYILHQGALPSVPRSVNDPITTNDVNVLGTLNILEAAKEFDVRRVVIASSSSIYGDSEVMPKVENMPVKPLSPYALTKYAQEKYGEIFYQLYGLETVSLRYFNVFGPNQDPTSQYSAVIPKFIKLMMNDREPTIYGDGTQSRDFTYVDNNVSANLLACNATKAVGEVLNIACGESYTLLELVQKINEQLGKNIEPKFEKERAGDVKHSLAGIEKAKDILNYSVEVEFEEGLAKTIESIKRSND